MLIIPDNDTKSVDERQPLWHNSTSTGWIDSVAILMTQVLGFPSGTTRDV